jgi:hypothetical protein
MTLQPPYQPPYQGTPPPSRDGHFNDMVSFVGPLEGDALTGNPSVTYNQTINSPNDNIPQRVSSLEKNQVDLYHILRGPMSNEAQANSGPMASVMPGMTVTGVGAGAASGNTTALNYGSFSGLLANNPNAASLFGGGSSGTLQAIVSWTYGGGGSYFSHDFSPVQPSPVFVDVTGAAGVLNYTAGNSPETLFVYGICYVGINPAPLPPDGGPYDTIPSAGLVCLSATYTGTVTPYFVESVGPFFRKYVFVSTPIYVPHYTMGSPPADAFGGMTQSHLFAVYSMSALSSISVGFRIGLATGAENHGPTVYFALNYPAASGFLKPTLVGISVAGTIA